MAQHVALLCDELGPTLRGLVSVFAYRRQMGRCAAPILRSDTAWGAFGGVPVTLSNPPRASRITRLTLHREFS